MKQFTITLQGRTRRWSFTFLGDPSDWPEWEADGLEVHLLCNTVPAWVPWWGIRAWVVIQDVINFAAIIN